MQTDTPNATESCPWCDSPITRAKFVEVETKIRDKEKRKLDEQRRELEQQFRREAEEQKKAAERKAKEDAGAQIAEMRTERDAAVQKTLEVEQQTEAEKKEAVAAESKRVREAVEREHEKVLLEKAVAAARDQESLQKKIGDLQRQIEKQTANELGDGAEIDLYDTLRDLFPADDITRVKKGEPGADIWIKVRHKGEVCGLILIDSKNRKSWQTNFATKLREDQVEAEADYAILSTTTFPKEKKQLTIESDVIVASPARAPEIVQILRSAIIKLHVLGLSNERRAEKRDALYEYITSENFSLKTGEIGRLTEKLLDLEVQETRQHRTVWKKRGTMLKQQQHALQDIDVEVSAIIQGDPQDTSD